MITRNLNDIRRTDAFVNNAFAHTFWTNNFVLLITIAKTDAAALTNRTFFFKPSQTLLPNTHTYATF